MYHLERISKEKFKQRIWENLNKSFTYMKFNAVFKHGKQFD